MIYYINFKKDQNNNAGSKAPDDIARICQELQFCEFSVPSLPVGLPTLKSKLWILFNASSWWKKLKKKLTKNDTVIIQHPMYGNRITYQKIKEIKKSIGCRFIAVVHDLESLRYGIEGEHKVNKSTSNIADNLLLKLFDKVICHNEHMEHYLLQKGFRKEQLINLEIFDYLCDTPFHKPYPDLSDLKIVIAGNLDWGKSRYIYEFGEFLKDRTGIQVNIYGNNFDQSKASSAVNYKGSFHPDDLPGVLDGHFGLVWDGISAESCVGCTGEYLKYNDPHKTSLYLASGIPVIVWKQAAIADFIIKNQVGITVESLHGIENEVNKLSASDYFMLQKNAAAIGEKLRNGYFTKKALQNALYA